MKCVLVVNEMIVQVVIKLLGVEGWSTGFEVAECGTDRVM